MRAELPLNAVCKSGIVGANSLAAEEGSAMKLQTNANTTKFHIAKASGAVSPILLIVVCFFLENNEGAERWFSCLFSISFSFSF